MKTIAAILAGLLLSSCSSAPEQPDSFDQMLNQAVSRIAGNIGEGEPK